MDGPETGNPRHHGQGACPLDRNLVSGTAALGGGC